MSLIQKNPPPDDSHLAQLRAPPHSLEAEQSVLGGLLLNNESYDRIGDVLTDRDFYRHEHRLIYDAACTLISASKPADVITVHEALQASRSGKDVALKYLNALAQSVPNAANIRRYAEIVRERSILRKIISASDESASAAFNPEQQTVAQVLERAQQRLADIGDTSARGNSGFIGTEDLVVGLLDRIQDMHDQGGREITGIATGFTGIDSRMGGLEPGDLVVLAARPSMGKTALALNIAEHVAVKEQEPVLVFSMEMGAQQLALRLVASLGRIQGQKLRRGTLTDFDWSSLSDAAETLRRANIYVDESPSLTVGEIRARSRRKARDCGGKIGLIVIDYLQLMSGPAGGDENRATALGEISRGLKALAKELQCPVLALSQLNRSVETRNDKRPAMSDLRESGAIEQDADVIMFIYRDDYYNKQSREPGVAEIIIAKSRNGPTGTERLLWLAPMTKFDNLAADYQPPTAPASAPAREL